MPTLDCKPLLISSLNCNVECVCTWSKSYYIVYLYESNCKLIIVNSLKHNLNWLWVKETENSKIKREISIFKNY